MGGEIDLSSRQGEGTLFTLRLPYRPTETIAVGAGEEPSPDRSKMGVVRLQGRVLVVEDTPALQRLESQILERMGLFTTVAGNGQEAIEMVSTQDFDLILMDMHMPVMDGVEATRELRRRGVYIPIVALTANVMPRHRQQFEDAGCNAFVEKPIDKEILQRVLMEHLQAIDRTAECSSTAVEPEETACWRVLAIDDEPGILSLYEALLSRTTSVDLDALEEIVRSEPRLPTTPLPIRYDRAQNGREGYQRLLQALEEGDPYSVVLLDMHMPGGWDGMKTAEMIRAVDRDVRINFISAYMDHNLQQVRDRIGVNFEFLQKPINSDELVQLVLAQAKCWNQKRQLTAELDELRHSRRSQ